jgi:hypothetical protein
LNEATGRRDDFGSSRLPASILEDAHVGEVKRFRIEWDEREIEDIKSRVKNVRWPPEIPGQGWEYGTNVAYMKELADYWLTKYNWQEQLEFLNQFPHYRTEIDGLGLHFIKVEGKGPDPPDHPPRVSVVGPHPSFPGSPIPPGSAGIRANRSP